MSLKKRSNSRRRRNPKHKSLRGGSKKRLPKHPKNLDAKILSIATFLRMYPHSKSQDQFYTILRQTKTFRCFYSFVNKVFGNMDEQLFSVLFLSFMISTSGKTSSFSFKDFIIRAVPTIVGNKTQIDEIDAVMVKFGNGLSKLVYEECVMAKRPSARTKMSASAAAGHRTTATRPFRGVGGKRNIRKTRTNKKYVQTGGDLLFIAELIMIFFEVIRRNTGYGGSISSWILPATLLLFFMLEISGQFSSIDFFGIGAGAPGGSAAVATAAAATAPATATAGNLPGFIARVSEFMQGVQASDFPGGYESPASSSPYTSAVQPQSTAAQRSAATGLITSQILFPQLSAISAIQIPELENAFELSPVREGVRLEWEDFLECLGLPNIEYVIEENASRIATLLRESQDVGMIPPTILDVHVDEIYTRLVEVFNQIDSTYNEVMDEAVVRIQCANPERRSLHIADRLFVQQRSDAAASAAREQEVFDGYVRLAATGGIVLSSATARNLLIRIFKFIRSIVRPTLQDVASRPSVFPGLRPRPRAVSPPRATSPDLADRSRFPEQPPHGASIPEALEHIRDIDPLTALMGNLSIRRDNDESNYDEFGNPKSDRP
jgi:hypothetical protein